ncbi:MAG: PEGA domain-containing protein [bacterium]
MKILKKLFMGGVVCLLVLSITGCASIFKGDPSMLNIMSSPEKAKVTILGSHTGEKIKKTTPCSVTLNKGSDYMVKIELAGYESENIVIRREITGWFWGNILLGGLIGMVIDGSTNNMWEHTPTVINIDLDKLTSLPKTIEIEYPVTLLMEDGTKVVKNLPITFHQII